MKYLFPSHYLDIFSDKFSKMIFAGFLRPGLNKFFLISALVIFMFCCTDAVFAQQKGQGGRGGSGGGSNEQTGDKERSEQERPGAQSGPRGESALPVAKTEITERYNAISVGGRLQPSTKIDHQALADGFVISVSVREGQRVHEGQALFTIERDDISGSYKPVVVTSRISGIVSNVSVQKENEVRSGQSGVVIVGTDGYILNANISDKDAFKVDVGEPVNGRTIEGDTIKGYLVSRSPEPDYSTGLFPLTFEFPNSQNAYIGQFVMVDLPVDKVTGIFVERELLVRRYGEFFLWVVDDSNVLHARQVSTGPLFGEHILIEEGLEPGDRYLTRLTGREREGMELGAHPQGQGG